MKDEWISVEEQLPKQREMVLVCFCTNTQTRYAIDWLIGDEWAGDSNWIPEYWQPLPAAPESTKEKP